MEYTVEVLEDNMYVEVGVDTGQCDDGEQEIKCLPLKTGSNTEKKNNLFTSNFSVLYIMRF